MPARVVVSTGTMTEKWYYDTKTGEVLQGKNDSWSNRMGPYDTQAEAAAALETARKNTAAQDAYDEEDD
ncbi:hypothetical protein CAURIC_03770 [Corynebacterium auriscanis]|nr:hypothetical protein CAURIC_03770 [Corynebacterium auriscanis]